MNGKRLAVLTTHPIQYHSPWFRALALHPKVDLQVLFCHKATPAEQSAAGFGVEFEWDVSLLEGYPHRFLQNVARCPGIANFTGLDTPEIKDIIAQERFDAVMINGWHHKSAWQAMRACWQTRTPVMVRSDSHLHHQRPLLKQMAKRPFYSWFISKLDACLPVGTWSSDYFLHYGAEPERVIIVPHVVDTDYFANELSRLAPIRKALRGRWGLEDDAVVFLFAGKFIENKRPLEFVQAVSEAAKAGSKVAGLMVGDGPLRSDCEELVKTRDIPITFAGFLNQSRMGEAYVAVDALVLPSTTETWGMVVNEAMACGRPCFVSDQVGCGPDMITSETGGVYPVGDTTSLAGMLSAFAANKARRNRMSESARAQTGKYTLSVAVERTIQTINTVTR